VTVTSGQVISGPLVAVGESSDDEGPPLHHSKSFHVPFKPPSKPVTVPSEFNFNRRDEVRKMLERKGIYQKRVSVQTLFTKLREVATATSERVSRIALLPPQSVVVVVSINAAVVPWGVLWCSDGPGYNCCECTTILKGKCGRWCTGTT
jgi:hypothetical protein